MHKHKTTNFDLVGEQPTTYCRELHTQDHMRLEQEKLFLCLPPQEPTDLEIFAPSNTRVTFKIVKCDMS